MRAASWCVRNGTALPELAAALDKVRAQAAGAPRQETEAEERARSAARDDRAERLRLLRSYAWPALRRERTAAARSSSRAWVWFQSMQASVMLWP